MLVADMYYGSRTETETVL